MKAVSIGRRFALGAIALTISTVLLRTQVSSALVGRGDELAARAHTGHAVALYRRALWLDPDNAVAIDRLAFEAMMGSNPVAIRTAITTVNAYLDRVPGDRTLLWDRAMCERKIGLQGAAERDFVELGRDTHAPQAYTFAGYAALRQGSTARAKRWWHAALAIVPTYYPARHALVQWGLL